ncbi:MAG TPA: DUF4234 domain-containing protein [Mycobacteriales bacterium]|jgi:hypothetical protein
MSEPGSPPSDAPQPSESHEPEKSDTGLPTAEASTPDDAGSMSADADPGSAPPAEAVGTAVPEGGAGYPAQAPYGAYPGPTGPLGETRKIGMSILLAIVTLGIYCFYWVYQTQKEVKDHSGIGVGGGLGLLLYFLIGIVTVFLVPAEINEMMRLTGRESKVSGLTGFWMLIPLAGPFIWFPKVQGQLNEYWESLGAPPP